MRKVIDRKVYDTEKAARIATNDFSDGSNEYKFGRTESLYKAKNGGFFVVRSTCWEGENTSLVPLSEDEAITEYENMYNQVVDFESAFPEVKIEDA